MESTGIGEPKQRAVELYNQRDFAGAAEQYRLAITAEPQSHVLYRGLALSLANAGSNEEALSAAGRAVDLQPSDAENQYVLGFALGKAGRWDEAIRTLDSALFLNPAHAYAKPALVAALMEFGKEIGVEEPRDAVAKFDRALKLDRGNPYALTALLDALVRSHQRGQVANHIEAADPRVREMEPAKSFIQKLANDPEYAATLKQTKIDQQLQKSHSVNTVAAPIGTSSPKHIPCPNCRQMIMDFAAICPHCNFRIKATGTFANHDRGPNVIWQEVALTIAGSIYAVLAIVGMVLTFRSGLGGMNDFSITMDAARVVVGLGLIFRWEWIGFIAKIFLWISLLMNAFFAMAAIMLGLWLPALILLVSAGISGFLIYLIGYCMD